VLYDAIILGWKLYFVQACYKNITKYLYIVNCFFFSAAFFMDKVLFGKQKQADLLEM
jgi:hypothetical protein